MSDDEGLERLRWVEHAVRQAPALIGITRGPDHVFELTNDAMAKAMGSDRAIEGRPGREALPELAAQGFFEVVEGVLRTGEPFVGREVPAKVDRSGDGRLEEAFFTYVYQPIWDRARERVEGVMAHASDVTDIVRARHAAEAAEARLAELIRGAPDGIVVLEADGRVRSANPAAERIFGRSADELVGEPLPWPSAAALGELTAGRILEPTTVAIPRPGAEPLTVEVHARGGADPDGRKRIEMVVRDVTERVRAEARERLLERQLVHTQRMESIGRLASGIAHDFNNLLSVVLTESELLLESAAAPEDAREGARSIREAAERAAALVRSLLAFAREQRLEPVVVDVGGLMEALHPLLARIVGAERTLTLDVGPGAHRVRADKTQLEQVFVNLVVNARDATPPGGSIEVVVERLAESEEDVTEGSAPGPQVCVRVKDTGTGMTPEVMEHIFEPFFTTKPDGGTGLGLATAHGVVRQSGGDILVRSAPGEGTEFRVCLPACEG